ncbi:MAG: hypothetical protein J6U44_06220 [Paludibacteraceae bacterium]|nr:hypothetical protein [Paludibacteraceae bacterium]
MKRTIFLFVIPFCFLTNGFAQKFLWDVDFAFQFDNREYKSDLAKSKTFFGTRLAPEIGVGWDDPKKGTHSLMLGGDAIFDFGAKKFNVLPELTVYYAYNSAKFNAYAGILPRRKMIGHYSNAFLSDSIRFYDANMEGLLLQYSDNEIIKNGGGSVEIGIDWNSMYSKEFREKFLIFSAGHLFYKWFNLGYNFSMYHFAGSEQQKGVVDNILVSPYLGFDVTSLVPLDTLYIKAAYLLAYQFDRRNVQKPIYPQGMQIDVGIEKWGVGIYDAFYYGKNLMPYFEKYGHGLYWNEDFYRTNHKIYNRLEVYWHPLKRSWLDVKIRSVHHFEGKSWGWQQLITLNVNVGQKMFGDVKTWRKKRSEKLEVKEEKF